MKRQLLIPLVMFAAWCPLGAPALAQSKTTTFTSSPTSEMPQAVVISVKGKCEYSENGVTFIELRANHVLNQGVVLRTGPAARVDIFFRRIGTTVRLQPDSEIKLEKMTRSTQVGVSEMQTLLHLRKGRIFTAVRSIVPGSTLEIRNAAGRSVVEGSGAGRYIITADGTQVADKSSVVPLKVIGDTGITVIAPGQSYHAKEGKMLPVTAPEQVLTMIELDELHALAEEGQAKPAAKPATPATPKK